jgi:hypothetical protein
MALSEAALAEIKCLHQANELTLAEIGTRYRMTASAISRLARSRGWLMRSELLGYAPRLKLPTTPRARQLVVHRIYEAITKKLKQMEAEMERGTLTSEDFARDAKSVMSMLANADKTTTTGAHADEEQQPKSAEPATDDAVERLQREIIERFERIQRRRDAEAGSE